MKDNFEKVCIFQDEEEKKEKEGKKEATSNY